MRRLLEGSWLWAPLALTFALACDDGEATGGQAPIGGGSAEGASGQGGQDAGQVNGGGGGQPADASSSSTASGTGGMTAGRVHVVLFTHIEDATELFLVPA